MTDDRALIGRDQAWAALATAFAETEAGHGGLLLLAGDAGVGKTRLATSALLRSGLEVLHAGAQSAAASVAYGPVVAALRAFLRLAPDGLAHDHRLGAYLGALLPELGGPPVAPDRATLFEAVCWAFALIARRRPAVVFLDDLQSADQATLDLLPDLAARLTDMPLLLLGAYRGDGLPRGHPLWRARAELRRAGRLREVALAPLSPDETAAMAGSILGGPLSAALATLIYDRSEGLPLYIEELALTLADSRRVRSVAGRLELDDVGAGLPLPATIRDMVLLRADQLDATVRAILDAAAVAGMSFDFDLVAALGGGDEGVMQALAEGWLVEVAAGRGGFRHALVRDALYSGVPWPRRRALHRAVAAHLERVGAAPGLLAEHWLAARESEAARLALLRTADAACALHAYPDAARAARRALELWPEGQLEAGRIEVLDQLARCVHLSGGLAEAVRLWQEVATAHRRTGNLVRQAEVQRQLAGVYEVQGAWEHALAARDAAATAFETGGRPAEAAEEHLAMAAHLRSAASYARALELLERAALDACDADRLDLQVRILGLAGNVRTRMGQYDAGLAQMRSALAMALEHGLTTPAAEVYQRLADAIEHTGDYPTARRTYASAAEFCYTHGVEATAQVCLACMSAVLCRTGDWEQCVRTCREVLQIASPPLHARTVATGMLGLTYALRGAVAQARPLLVEAASLATQIELTAVEILSGWGLAVADAAQGADGRAAERCREILARWARSDDRHYSTAVLRWAVSVFGVGGAEADARACAAALARIVADTGTVEATAALSHALGELSLLDHQPIGAVQHFQRALDHLDRAGLPYDRAHTMERCGLALVAAGRRDQGVKLLANAYRLAHNLGARPLASTVAVALADLGEPIDRRLGRRAARLLDHGGLTRRELEVIHLVARGHTDREIARLLVLSPRTVEMHVANSLAKLGCRSRAEAVARVADLGLLTASTEPTESP